MGVVWGMPQNSQTRCARPLPQISQGAKRSMFLAQLAQEAFARFAPDVPYCLLALTLAPKLSPAHQGQRAGARATVPVKADTSIVKQVYLVTIPHPRTTKKRLSAKTSPPPLPLIRSPAEFDHAAIERAILDSVAIPVYDNPGQRPPAGGIPLEMMAIFRELHQADAAAGPGKIASPSATSSSRGSAPSASCPLSAP